MNLDVNMAPELVEDLAKIAIRFGASLDTIFERMAKRYIQEQTEYFEELGKMPADEVWPDLLGPTYRVQMKEAEKENKNNGVHGKVIFFPTI